MDIIGGLVPKRTVYRLFTLVVFAALLIFFRKLLVLLVFFVAFERMLGWPSEQLAKRTKLPRKIAVIAVAVAMIGAFSVAVTFGVIEAVKSYKLLQTLIPEKIESFKHTRLFTAVQEHFEEAGGIVEKAQEYAVRAVSYLTEFGHMVLFAVIGFVFAFVYLLEREEIDELFHHANPRSVPGRLLRWFGFVTDSIKVTLQFQVVVAIFNAVTTLPVMVLLGIPNAMALMAGIFFSALIPVVGNFAAGLILTLMAYQTQGWTGVIVFTVLTFVLHKVESYYLSPRLAQKHVKIPSFLLLVSLIVWEQLIGVTGLLVSFPFLFVAAKIRQDLKNPPPDPFLELEEEAEEPPPAGPMSIPPKSTSI